MNSDELGEKGESRFKEICADAGLICNKSDRDRAGWDFIVEFPFFAPATQTLDSRASPVSCHIQLKTQFEGNRSFKMRLSSAERLAKDLKPAFIYVFVVNQDLIFTDAFLVHLLDSRLGSILKRLRSEHARGIAATQLNKKSVSITPTPSERLAPTGSALRDALMSIVNGGMYPYSESKNQQLKKLGFDSHPFESRVTLKLSPDDDIGEVFLGLKRQIPVEDFQTFSNRFGIRLPDFRADSGVLTIEPEPADQCSVIVRDDSPLPPAVFAAEIFYSAVWPQMQTGKFARITSSLFSLVFSHDSYRLSYEVGSPISESPANWSKFWRMLLALSSGTGSIQVVSQNRPIDFVLKVPSHAKFPEASECKYWMQVCNDATTLLLEAGVHPEPHIEFDDIASKEYVIRSTTALLTQASKSLSVSGDVTTEPGSVLPAIEKAAIVSLIRLGPALIGCYRVGQTVTHQPLSESQFKLTVSNFSSGHAKLLRDDEGDFDKFAESVMTTERTSVVLLID